MSWVVMWSLVLLGSLQLSRIAGESRGPYPTPSYTAPTPSYTTPSYTTPSYTTPSYTHPTADYTLPTPDYTPPVYTPDTPDYTTPSYTSPVYTPNTPDYTTPGYTTPPVYTIPIHPTYPTELPYTPHTQPPYRPITEHYPTRPPPYLPTTDHYPTLHSTHYPTRTSYYPSTRSPYRPTTDYYPTRQPSHYPTRPTTEYYPTRPSHYPTRPSHYPTRPSHYPTRPSHYPTQPSHYPTRQPNHYPTRPTMDYYPTRKPNHYPTRRPYYGTTPRYGRHPKRPLPPACTFLKDYVVMLKNAVEEAACRNHYDKKMIRKDEYDSEDKCLAATVSAIRRCTKAKKLDTDCVAYFFRILDKEWSKLDSDYKYSGKRKDECYACDSLLDIYRTEVVAQAVLCGEGDVILTVEGKHPPPQWFDWLSRPDNKDEEFFDGVTDVLDRTLNIFSDKDNDKGYYDRDGNYYGPADKNKYEQMDGVLHDTLNLVDDHFSYMGQKVADFHDDLKDFVNNAEDVIKDHVWGYDKDKENKYWD